MSKIEFKFQDDPNTACFVCDHVFNKERPILFVSHDEEDSSWQFLCGQDDHNDNSAKIISLKQAVELDETINELYEMPVGIYAEREEVGKKWTVYKM